MKKTNKSLRRITATLVAMAASASFAAAPLSGAGVTFNLPTFSALAADAETLTYKDFSYKVTDDGIVITAYSGTEAKPVIPSAIDETPVISIGSLAFAENASITSVIIPSSITTIEWKAFINCTNLEEITLNEGLTTLGYECFANTKIATINIPSTLTSIDRSLNFDAGPFENCNLLKDVTFNNNTTAIISFLFDGCTGLETITIPDSITSIGNSAFSNCTSLTEIEIPGSVKTIDTFAFLGCTSLEKVILNEGLTTLGKKCFSDTIISSIYIPSTLTTVSLPAYQPQGPFYENKTLKEVTIGDKIAEIPAHLFDGCVGLEKVNIPDTVKTIGNSAFSYCYALKEVDIPYSVTTIKAFAFEDCRALKDITIHNPYCDIYNKEKTISSTTTIKGYTTSTAKKYAESYEREFVSIGSFTLGDVNEDGMVDSSDASMVLAEYALIQTGGEPTFTEIQKISADVNKDYSVDSSDASLILAYYADASTGKNPTWD